MPCLPEDQRWAIKSPGGWLYHFCYVRQDAITEAAETWTGEYHTPEERISEWKKMRKDGHRVVKVRVTEI